MGVARIVQTSPPGPTLNLPVPPADYLRQGGGARWERVEHERGKTSIRFMGVDEHAVSLSLMLDDQIAPGTVTPPRPAIRFQANPNERPWRWTDTGLGDVEDACQLLHRWALPVDPTDVSSEPPQVQIAFFFGQQLRYVLDGEPEWIRQEFDTDTGRRVHAEVTLNLVEAEFAVIGLSPVEAATAVPDAPAAVAPSPAERTHVVAPGESLTSIAQALLGNGARYKEIAELNELPDADLIVIGQTLRIPSS